MEAIQGFRGVRGGSVRQMRSLDEKVTSWTREDARAMAARASAMVGVI